MSAAPKVRLLKVVVQPVFVLDHGTHLEEIQHPPVTVAPQDWPAYSGERFPAEVAEWERQLANGD